MSSLAHLSYGFRRVTHAVDLATAGDDDAATLATIDDLLVRAGEAHHARRYSDALALYERARAVLWGQLFPLTRLDEEAVRHVDLHQMLTSYAAEWLNVLPVEQASTGVRPRATVDVAAPVVGLLSAATGAKQTSAVADFDLSQVLAARGNTDSAAFFRRRAEEVAPDLVGKLAEATTPANPAGPTPVNPGPTPVNPAGPASPGGPFVRRLGAASQLSVRTGFNRVFDVAQLAGSAGLLPSIGELNPLVVPAELTVAQRTYAVPVGDTLATITWAAGAAPDPAALTTAVYEVRKTAKVLPDILIRPVKPADAAVALTHAWYYETPLGIAECLHALGRFSEAETWYRTAADYAYLNAEVEAPYLWGRLANLYLDWGDSLFRADDPANARTPYEQVLTLAGAVPATSPLYAAPGLAPAADQAKQVIAGLADPGAIPTGISPAIAAAVLDVWAQLAKIAGGLDFWGHWANNVPIWTFDYLQSVASTFAQLAIGAERDAMGFWEKADAGELTRTQLTGTLGMAQAEAAAVQAQVAASQQERMAYQKARDLAQLRAGNAAANVADYAGKSAEWITHNALSAQLSGGESGNASQLNALADQMYGQGYRMSGDRGTLAAAESLTAARLQRDYEIDAMQRQAGELTAAVGQAQQELNAATARVTAALAGAAAAQQRVTAAKELLAAFDGQRFTPDVWHALGERMNALSQRYLAMALDVAKRMQRAYNFENDTDLRVIRPDYVAAAVQGLLAADTLMADIQSFTYDLVTSTAPAGQPVKQTISLATRYPYLFESQLRRTGAMAFETTLDDFDALYPGSYAGRISHVDVEVDGIIPARGVSGTLANTGISHYRVPAAAGGGIKHRIQTLQTQVISDFDVRGDALLYTQDRRRRAVFEGAGLASGWTLSLPPAVNEMDLATLLDVRLTVTYQARFDPDLRDTVLAELAARPGVHERTRPFPTRWVFADAYFAFARTGVLEFPLTTGDFAATETDPRLTGLSLVVATTPPARAAGIVLDLTAPGAAPGAAPVTVTTDAEGSVPQSALAAAVTGQSALGDYRIVLDAAKNPGWVTDGRLDLDAIDNIALVTAYSFTPRG